jgi:hypothetical protein
MTRGQRVDLSELFEILHAELVAKQMEENVLQSATVSKRDINVWVTLESCRVVLTRVCEARHG